MIKITKGTKLYNCILTVSLLTLATILSFFFYTIIPDDSANIALTYILALVMIARYTDGYVYGVLSSIFSVISVNFFFTYPHFELNFVLAGYPVTFLAMLTITLLTSTQTTHMKRQAKILANHEKQLMEADKEKMRANLLRAVSHDLRTPLTSIIGSISSYIDGNSILSDDEKMTIAQNIYSDSNWLLNMVENILSVTRIQNSQSKVKKRMEVVEEVVSEAVTRLKKRIPKAKIKISIPDEFLLIPMDALLIEQVIINLLENAIVHSKSILPIEFNITADSENVFFQIKDFGVGISESKLSQIFDGIPSYDAKSADSQKGMGIGLSICKTIISAHDGTIFANNHEGGAEFTFILPRDERSNENE